MADIPWWLPEFGTRERSLVQEVFDSNFVNDGAVTTEFEQRMAERLGCPYAVATTSGTTALFLALAGLDVGAGDEVIVPDVTFVASANAVTLTGATPVIVDVDPATLAIDPPAVRRALTPQTRAIMPVHISGRAAPMPEILEIAREHDLVVVEDAAEALHSKRFGSFLGTQGDAGCFSLSPNKTISSGQGGIVVTANEALHRRLRELKDQGRPVRGTGGADEHVSVGFNFKLTNLQAAVALGQLERLDDRIAAMTNNARIYLERLGGHPRLTFPGFDLDNGEVPQWVDVLCDDREALLDHLEQNSIDCRRFWHPLHRQAPYQASDGDFPVATAQVPKAFWLPSGFNLTEDQVRFVCDSIQDFLGA